jgi:hypothetical protein
MPPCSRSFGLRSPAPTPRWISPLYRLRVRNVVPRLGWAQQRLYSSAEGVIAIQTNGSPNGLGGRQHVKLEKVPRGVSACLTPRGGEVEDAVKARCSVDEAARPMTSPWFWHATMYLLDAFPLLSMVDTRRIAIGRPGRLVPGAAHPTNQVG